MSEQKIENRDQEVVNKFRAAIYAKEHRKKKKKKVYAGVISGLGVLIGISLLMLYLNVSDSYPPEGTTHHSARLALDAGSSQNQSPPLDLPPQRMDDSLSKVSAEAATEKKANAFESDEKQTSSDINRTESETSDQPARSAESEVKTADTPGFAKNISLPDAGQAKTDASDKAAEPEEKVTDGIRIAELVTCRKVENKAYVSPDTEFSLQDGSRPEVWVWMDVRSAESRLPYMLRHEYYFNKQKYAAVVLDIKYPRMRTWSNITLDHEKYAGEWRVEVLTADKQKIAETRFSVTP